MGGDLLPVGGCRDRPPAAIGEKELQLMKPHFSVDRAGFPDAAWDDHNDPRQLVAGFINAEIGLLLTNVEAFLEGIEEVRAGKQTRWQWHGNSNSVTISRDGCLLQ